MYTKPFIAILIDIIIAREMIGELRKRIEEKGYLIRCIANIMQDLFYSSSPGNNATIFDGNHYLILERDTEQHYY